MQGNSNVADEKHCLVCAALEERVCARHYEKVDDVKAAFTREWENIPQDICASPPTHSKRNWKTLSMAQLFIKRFRYQNHRHFLVFFLFPFFDLKAELGFFLIKLSFAFSF